MSSRSAEHIPHPEHSPASEAVAGNSTRSAVPAGTFARNPQFVIVADESSLASLEAMMVTLPLCASGRVFIEAPSPADVVPIAAPSRMSVTWLVRSERSGDVGSCEPCGRGEAVRRAVAAWSSEMLVSDEGDAASGPSVVLQAAWLSGSYHTVSAAYEVLIDGGLVPSEIIDTPPQFFLDRA